MILAAVLTTLYWFSFAYVGLHVLVNLESRWKSAPISKDPLVRLFVGICLGFTVFIPLALVGYLFSAPIEPIAITWAAIFALFIVKFRYSKDLKLLVKTIVKNKYLWLWGAVLSVDYLVSLYLGGYFSGDAWGHMARINDLLENGFSIYDPYFPSLIDARASLNIIHPIYAAGGFLINLSAPEVWLYSLSFFRFLLTLSVYVVMRTFIKSRPLAAMVSMVSLVVLSYDWRFVLYPNKISRVWLIFVAFGLLRLLKNPKDEIGRLILVSGALLAGLSHPVFAVGIAAFVLVTVILHWLIGSQKAELKRYKWVLFSVPFFFIHTLVGLLVPTRGIIGGAKFDTQIISFLGFDILNPTRIFSVLYVLIILLLIVYLYKARKSKALKSIALGSLLTFPIIAFTPVFEAASQFLSPSIIRRYRSDTNILAYILSLPILILPIVYLIVRKIKMFSKYTSFLLVVTASLIVVTHLESPKKFISTQLELKSDAMNNVENLKRALEGINLSENELLVAEEDASYILPSIDNVSVIKIPNGHAARSADPIARRQCLDELFSSDDRVRRSAMISLRPEYYLLDRHTEYLNAIPELSRITENRNTFYELYKVDYVIELFEGYDKSEACNKIANNQA